jgi:hypothetical protein
MVVADDRRSFEVLPGRGRMGNVEYRIERIPVSGHEPRLLPVVERLTELGRQGWHVASIDLAAHAAHDREPLTVLLEREADSTPARRAS